MLFVLKQIPVMKVHHLQDPINSICNQWSPFQRNPPCASQSLATVAKICYMIA